MQYGNHAFSFDKVARLLDIYYQELSGVFQIHWTDTTQLAFFESVVALEIYHGSTLFICGMLQTSKHLIDCVLKGINSCCCAYGQTGSGKTYRYKFSCSDETFDAKYSASIFGESGSKSGLLPRSIEYLFAKPQVKSMVRSLLVNTSQVTNSYWKGSDIGSQLFGDLL